MNTKLAYLFCRGVNSLQRSFPPSETVHNTYRKYRLKGNIILMLIFNCFGYLYGANFLSSKMSRVYHLISASIKINVILHYHL